MSLQELPVSDYTIAVIEKWAMTTLRDAELIFKCINLLTPQQCVSNYSFFWGYILKITDAVFFMHFHLAL